MKRLLKTLLLSTSLITSLSASTFLNIGYSWIDFKYLSERIPENTYIIGIGADHVFKNGLFLGIDADYSYANLKESKLHGVSTDLKIGGQITPRTIIYGICSAQYHEFRDTSSYAGGFGYGGGIETVFTKSFSSSLDFKSYKMEEKNKNNYIYDTLILEMKIKF